MQHVMLSIFSGAVCCFGAARWVVGSTAYCDGQYVVLSGMMGGTSCLATRCVAFSTAFYDGWYVVLGIADV